MTKYREVLGHVPKRLPAMGVGRAEFLGQESSLQPFHCPLIRLPLQSVGNCVFRPNQLQP
jgi:hypothetical protein